MKPNNQKLSTNSDTLNRENISRMKALGHKEKAVRGLSMRPVKSVKKVRSLKPFSPLKLK